jgi:hypothetical protein
VVRCQQHLERYEHDPNLLNRIVAIDETLFKSYDSKDLRSAAEWRLPTEREGRKITLKFSKISINFDLTFLKYFSL